MRCRSCCLSSASAFCCGVSAGVSVGSPATGTGASGIEVEADVGGKVGVAGVCAWAAPAKQSARSDAGSPNDEWKTVTLVLVAGWVPSLVLSPGFLTAIAFAEHTTAIIALRPHGN